MRRALLAASLAVAGCRPELPPVAPREMPGIDSRPPLLQSGQRAARVANYRIAAALDVETKQISATQTLTWRHTGVAPVATLPLHLYMNGFKHDGTVFMRSSRGSHRRARKPAESWGWIDVHSITALGVELRPSSPFGEDESTLTVPLPRAVLPGETITVDFRFTTQLPQVFARTGYAGAFFMVGQWFPKIGVLETRHGLQRWRCDTFHVNTEFFSDFGTYDVELTVPETHVVAATGVLTDARPASPGTRTLTFRAEDVHDFAWMADPWMKILRGTAASPHGDVEIRVYHRPGHEHLAPRHLEAARRTLETLSRLLVPYPWPIMSVIDPPWDAALGAGGMEYPMLVTAGSALPFAWLHLAEEVTVHEVAHNWFQGLLASNEADEAWLDEGLTEYATGLVLDDWFGPDHSYLGHPRLRVGYDDRARLLDLGALMTPIATPAALIPPHEYGPLTYVKTSATLKTLENMAGRARFLAALGLYARRHAFGHPTRDDLLAALRDGIGDDYGWFLEPALLGTGDIDYRVGDVRVEPAGDAWSSEVTIERPGRVPADVEILFRWDDGDTALETWRGGGTRETFSHVRPSPLVAIEIDPDEKLVLEHRRLDNAVAVKRPGPAWRAAARAGFWLQTLQQVVGL
jgi:hypothetical protein